MNEKAKNDNLTTLEEDLSFALTTAKTVYKRAGNNATDEQKKAFF